MMTGARARDQSSAAESGDGLDDDGPDDDGHSGSGSESPILQRDHIETHRAVGLLNHGDVELVGRLPHSSNATFLVDVCHDGLLAQAIYKPERGERRLWDFPAGLAHREAGAFLVAHALGWDLVPPTVVREDLPLDRGSLQLFMPAHFEEHYFTLVGEQRLRPAFQRICALDVVINNTDRKSGHCLLGTDDRIWAIDNGLSFHSDFKLRTVIWDFAGQELPDPIIGDLSRLLADGLPERLAATLRTEEQDATFERAGLLLSAGRFPSDGHGHRWPWPLV